jgi:hypothetical protein
MGRPGTLWRGWGTGGGPLSDRPLAPELTLCSRGQRPVLTRRRRVHPPEQPERLVEAEDVFETDGGLFVLRSPPCEMRHLTPGLPL